MHRFLFRIFLFISIICHAEFISASPIITETLVSASPTFTESQAELDSTSGSLWSGFAPPATGIDSISIAYHRDLQFDSSPNVFTIHELPGKAIAFPFPTDSAKRVEIRSLRADTEYHHITRDAALWSAFIPGAGQIYNEFGYRKLAEKKNRAWWKVPVIYGLLGTTFYYFRQYTVTSKRLKDEWIFRNDSLGKLYPEYDEWDANELLDGKSVYLYDDLGNHLIAKDGSWAVKHELGFDDAAKRRDYLIFGFAAIWGLQVIEALVDAHFVTFDVSEDLTFSWAPTMLGYSTPGVALKLEFQ